MESNYDPLVSVVIPSYNMERHITETLVSVQNQTLEAWEAIVVDDCSTDSTPQIVNEFAEQDPRIRYFRLPENSNLPAVPRNYGIEQARGKYVALLDHDDLWSPQKLQRQIRVLEADETLAMAHSHLWVRRNGRSFPGLFYLPSPRQSVATESKLKKRNVIQCSSVVIRKDVLQGLGGFDESLNLRAVEDYHLWFRVSQRHRIVFISEIHGEYRLDSAGTSARENMQNRLWEIDQSIGTDSFSSQRSWLQKIAEKALSFPSALFYLAIEGHYRQRFGAPPRFW